jgi:hypothetical protein
MSIAIPSNAGQTHAATIIAVAKIMTTMVRRAGERRVRQLWYATHAQPAATGDKSDRRQPAIGFRVPGEDTAGRAENRSTLTIRYYEEIGFLPRPIARRLENRAEIRCSIVICHRSD